MDNDKVISVLNNLIETCRDGQEGFKNASENVNDSRLKSLFYEYSTQRARFVGELQQEVRALGGDPENMGSIAATLHRGWMDLMAAISTKEDAAVLAECERGEDSAVSNYKDATADTLPTNIADIVNRQYSEIKQAHDKIRSLRNQAKTATS